MNKCRSGFTLMEIMVVIIVIAVLASVAGPMIGSITDQGRASATKSNLQTLKSALIAFQNDVGRFPYNDKATAVSGVDLKNTKGAYNNYGTDNKPLTVVTTGAGVLGITDDTNCLSKVDITDQEIYLNITNYDKRWKGPYMDGNPADFMFDAWGNQVRYEASGRNLYLWSPGADGNFSKIADAEKGDEEQTDDILVSVAKFREEFK
ncbi:MAG: prepilin-type N-terminal cleavage/methylation domain-containing protein [Erysipelotrichia bacterium]|nr:prepilin-type N-terminal cleavage/methylation domain-containing protein [Erysipelotrichia bacterium]